MLNRLQKTREDKGFTLVELLVVIVIIGILAGIAIPLFLSQREKAAEAGVKSDLKNAATIMETYYVDEQTYVGTATAPIPDFSMSKDNTVTVAGTTTATTFCLDAVNSSYDGIEWKYDSAAGGLVKGTC